MQDEANASERVKSVLRAVDHDLVVLVLTNEFSVLERKEFCI
jgi:hypothetical protein